MQDILTVYLNCTILFYHAYLITDYAFLTGINFIFLFPYHPEMNPLESVWKLVKEHARHNRNLRVPSDLKNALSQEVSKHSRPNKELGKL